MIYFDVAMRCLNFKSNREEAVDFLSIALLLLSGKSLTNSNIRPLA
jgi:hypothetical protein